MLNTEQEIKRWTIQDRLTGEIFDITDQRFQEGLKNNYIELKGQFITVEHNHKIWIDAISK